MTSVGIVVIGRNEGERLRRCLGAIRATGVPCVYVDSGSSDGSVELAQVVIGTSLELDDSKPFTAARGRNEGFSYLLGHHPEMVFVQFVDGDCELDPGWIARASRELLAHPDVAIVCGRLREAQPMASMFNLLCEIEWSRPAGVTDACGGIFMVRADAFRDVNGFDATVAAGEEPDLCLRLRRCGWRIVRVDAPMATHDAGMPRFGQWWRRALRSGRSVMESIWRTWPGTERRELRRVLSIVVWTIGVPTAALAAVWLIGPPGWLLLTAYPLQWLRLWWRERRSRHLAWRASAVSATFTFIGKVAELIGLFQVIQRRVSLLASSSNSGARKHQVKQGRSHARL